MSPIRNMKKEYIKPSIEATEIEAQMMMAASNEVHISDTVTEDDASMSNDRRRGSWGNLWK